MTHLWWHEDRTPEIDPLGDDQAAIEARPGPRARRRRHRDPRARRGVPHGSLGGWLAAARVARMFSRT